ncbi:hypothetical protein [Coraliomargarita akajimensis]|uniref:Conserved repeat domain protein n=1 Tax=Coraliomargarita akajimensis (strain DSM 45221 / IAM 15411 / JCM 23193 / KCTC 12865 / 04OKA010-24) TaxID=583355 RepID=D5EIR4_CORAD|nr:hypothetical protein [Coraliomargarita akajimensis]ADE54313.1 conserved repeat domain protein [Coraliomargarita akajimensis DSM 45221]
MNKFIKDQSLGIYAAGFLALAAMTPGGLFAQTAPDTDVENTATVSYEIDGVDQPDESGSVTFEVDALVNPTVANTSGTDIVPDQQDAVLAFTVTNDGNQTQDFVLNIEQPTGDDANLSNVQVFIDANDNDSYDDGVDTLITPGSAAAADAVQDLAAGDSISVFVVGDVPDTLSDTDTIDVNLVAIAYDPGADNTTIGAIETETAVPAIDAVDTVFGDESGAFTGDTALNGEHSDTGTYTVGSVSIAVTKTAAVTDDGLDNGTTEQLYIPGATVTYTITIAYSGSASQTADAITLSDPLPDNTTFVANSILINGAAAVAPDTASYDGGTDTVTVTLDAGRAGDASNDVVTFEVTID